MITTTFPATLFANSDGRKKETMLRRALIGQWTSMMGSTWMIASGESRTDIASRARSAIGCALAKAVAVANNDHIGEQFRQKVVGSLASRAVWPRDVVSWRESGRIVRPL